MYDSKYYSEAAGSSREKLKSSDSTWLAHWMQPSTEGKLARFFIDDSAKSALEVPTLIKTKTFEVGESSESALKRGKEIDEQRDFNPDLTQNLEHDISSLVPAVPSVTGLTPLEDCQRGIDACTQYMATFCQKLQNYSLGLGTKRIDTTVEGCDGIPQTTQCLFVTKGFQVKLLKENDFGSSLIFTRIYRNGTCVLQQFSELPSRGRAGVEIHSLSSEDCKEENVEEDANNNKNTGNITSVETGHKEINFTKEKALGNIPKLGAYSTESHKGIKFDLNLPSEIEEDSCSAEVGEQGLNVVLPESNSKLPVSMVDSFLDNVVPGSPKTPSSEMKRLKIEQPKSRPVSTWTEPENRWTKRLKLTSATDQGTKITQLEERESSEKTKNFKRVSRTESSSGRSRGEIPPKVAARSNSNQSSLTDIWIQRWMSSRSKVNMKKFEAPVTCNPQRPKLTLESIQKNQFPSCAARVAVAKAWIDLKPCAEERVARILVRKGFLN